MVRSRQLSGTPMGTEFLDDRDPSLTSTLSPESSQLIVGEGHYGYPDFPPQRDVGGGFLLKGSRTSYGLVDVGEIWRGGALNQRYVGSVCATAASAPAVSSSDGTSYAAEAYSRMKPTKPLVQGLNFVYELKDIALHDLKNRSELLRKQMERNPVGQTSSYWLAVQFGWKPLLADLRKMYHFQRNAAKRIDWLIRNNGKPVRRFVQLSDVTTDPVTVSRLGYYPALRPTLVSQYYKQAPSCTDVVKSGERIWASARFRYWLPPGPRDVVWRRKLKHALFGLQPSPSVIYNMIPWSWLADWFSNIGDLIENLEAGVADRLAADYFYVMRHNWSESVRTTNAVFKRKSGVLVPVTSITTRTNFTKSRIHGDPFGFATPESSLNGMQLSILGALGLSRL